MNGKGSYSFGKAWYTIMVEIRICIGTACHLNGAHNVIAAFQHLCEEYGLHDKIDLEASFCMRQCDCKTVSVAVNGTVYRIPADGARGFFREHVLPLTGGAE